MSRNYVSTGHNDAEKLLDLTPSGMQVYSEILLCCLAMNSSGLWVAWIIEASVKPENLDSISSLMNEMSLDFMENERQTLNFEWSIDSTQTLLHLHERYEDSATALGHVKSFRSKYGERFLSLISPFRVVVYGHPSEPLSNELQPLRPVTLDCLGGFTR
jgi:quinol monooxygenase YgiN